MIKPKLEALAVAEGQLAAAEKKLNEASARLDKVNARLGELTATFEAQMAEKTRIEDGARALEKKMDMASQLINGKFCFTSQFFALPHFFACVRLLLVF